MKKEVNKFFLENFMSLFKSLGLNDMFNLLFVLHFIECHVLIA